MWPSRLPWEDRRMGSPDNLNANCRTSESLAQWEQTAAQCCVPLAISHERDADFSGSIQSATIADVCISRIAAGRHVAVHDVQSVSNTDGDYILACLQLQGAGKLIQDGRCASVEHHDLVLFDSRRPFRWELAEPFDQICIRFPMSLVTYRIPLRDTFVAHTISGTEGLGMLVAQHLITLCAERDRLARSPSAPQISASAADLVGGLLAEWMQVRPGPRTNLHSMHLQQLRQFISNNLRNPDLNADMAAAALGMSTRYLHRLVQQDETTIGRMILVARLERCAQWLSLKCYANYSIEQIAGTWGFASAAHFSRAFRAHYMKTPREYRLIYQSTPS
ncbi:TPA: AraC family transcriptional regulator [Burkholderia cepacia ATCC 25416]|uniref:AraC-like ligand-binding domain-containing protein n=1 Tax=Burkholderia cepacia TaxID=292 RepID=UPI001CF312BF|nr:helix-turn-helix domain-containing protein [Burkholderia cepacia]HDR9767637.1 AraC family transcriptional regulator [Burkholderia cepacia ATCC 25416]MCA8080390.1 helix-turn-helix domain-containing protein [Burkholderia cepacia]HDR9774839.1 AraC family transcriptional regulator [Burkholderia cepacia ATCC 25416]HDR9782150.1 AraC family transcriptional regulator [Burkholderia cepacia ATCC 25416]HDR9788506.1 AraC family transcriptional regulator [Burkholderia cepacia ATCC 25416]